MCEQNEKGEKSWYRLKRFRKDLKPKKFGFMGKNECSFQLYS